MVNILLFVLAIMVMAGIMMLYAYYGEKSEGIHLGFGMGAGFIILLFSSVHLGCEIFTDNDQEKEKTEYIQLVCNDSISIKPNQKEVFVKFKIIK